MTHKERFHRTVERKPVDRPACWLGIPDAEALPGLCAYFGVKDADGLRRAVNDDIYPVELPCCFPNGYPIYAALQFAKHQSARALTTPGFFEDYCDPSRVEEFDWPDPAKHIEPAACRRAVESAPNDHAVLGVLWSAHFQDALSAFGMEAALIKLLEAPDMFKAVIDRILEFYLQANRIFYEAAYKNLDAVLIGNDFGSQTGLILSAPMIREFVLPGTKKLVHQAKSYGIKVMHHACGAISEIIPDLIDLDVDIVHPIQALAADMEPENLHRRFGEKISFCGGVDAQHLLVSGTPIEIKEKVYELKAIFPTGLIISPSHEAVLPDINPANIKALFDAVRE
jgi:uroporphyrinogen decarboxylase